MLALVNKMGGGEKEKSAEDIEKEKEAAAGIQRVAVLTPQIDSQLDLSDEELAEIE